MASDPLLGAIFIFGGNFAPSGYAFCNGATLSISQNTALFSLLGTTYGGNGTSTFQLPNLQGRAPIGFGQSAGTSNYSQGETGGVESVQLTTNQMPGHNHTVAQNFAAPQTTNIPTGAVPAPNGAYSTAAPVGTMATQNTGSTGGTQPHENRAPFLVLNYIIALQGVFPSRN
jgi:microcystin-dependent protein